jgi:hypothetical protein
LLGLWKEGEREDEETTTFLWNVKLSKTHSAPFAVYSFLCFIILRYEESGFQPPFLPLSFTPKKKKGGKLGCLFLFFHETAV